jgi:hypothetical protein
MPHVSESFECGYCHATFTCFHQASEPIVTKICAACALKARPDQNFDALAAYYDIPVSRLWLMDECLARGHARNDREHRFGRRHDHPCVDCQLNAFRLKDGWWPPIMRRALESMSRDYKLPVMDLVSRLEAVSNGKAPVWD